MVSWKTFKHAKDIVTKKARAARDIVHKVSHTAHDITHKGKRIIKAIDGALVDVEKFLKNNSALNKLASYRIPLLAGMNTYDVINVAQDGLNNVSRAVAVIDASSGVIENLTSGNPRLRTLIKEFSSQWHTNEAHIQELMSQMSNGRIDMDKYSKQIKEYMPLIRMGKKVAMKIEQAAGT
jgi:ribosomal protein L18E